MLMLIYSSHNQLKQNNSKYLIGHLAKVIRPLVLILPKMSGCVETLKVKDGDKDENSKLMSFPIVNHKLLEKCKSSWTETGNLGI